MRHAVVMNQPAISHGLGGESETAQIHAKGPNDRLTVSRNDQHPFRQM